MDFDVLAQFTFTEAEDDPDGALELICDRCGAVVCGIEEGSGLANVADAADGHWRDNHA